MGNGVIRVYRISPWRRGLFAGLGFLIMLPILIAGLVSQNAGMFVACGIIALIWAPCYYLVHSARLILSAEGVQFKQLGYGLSTSWENVTRLWLLKGQEGFELAQPMENFSARMLSGTADSQFVVQSAVVDPVPGEDRRGLVVARRFIPLDGFVYWVDRGDLLDEIRRFAPQVADNPLRAIPVAENQTGQSENGKGQGVLIGSIIAGAVILGILMGSDLLPINVQWGIEKIIRVIIFVCIAIYAVFNLTWSVIYVRSGSWGRAALAALFGLMQVAFCILLFASE